MSFASFLSALRCSRPRAPRHDDTSLRPSRPWSPLNKKGRPRFILNHEGSQNAIWPHRYATVSTTTPTRAPFSMHAGVTRRMAPHVAITHAEADATIARRTEAPHPSLRRARFSDRFRQPANIVSTLGKRTPMCGLLTTA
jgi:hypothetical protein